MDSELKYYIALTMIKGVGPVIANKLIAALGNAKSVLEASPKTLENIHGIGTILAQQINEQDFVKRAEEELRFLDKVGGEVICFNDEHFPKRLKECDDCPLVLYTKGNMNLNVKKTIGIVGTRRMTTYGRINIETILEELYQKIPDLLVVSGLAYGVDGTAHKKSLDLGMQTVGVVGHGLDTIYPAAHRELALKMCSNGGIVTEFHSNSLIDRKNFVSRNRIIAGLSDVIWVVESGEKGGALLTSDFANSYNRDVCASPGRVNDTFSIGCNKLIKENKALLIESAIDIIELMNWDQKESKKEPIQLSLFLDLNNEERLIVQLLEMEGKMQVNQIANKLQIPMQKLSSLLFNMEMRNIVCPFPGMMYGLR